MEQDLFLPLILVGTFIVGMLFVWQSYKYSNLADNIMVKLTPSFICFLLVVIISLGGLATRQKKEIKELQKIIMKDSLDNKKNKLDSISIDK